MENTIGTKMNVNHFLPILPIRPNTAIQRKTRLQPMPLRRRQKNDKKNADDHLRLIVK